MTISPSRVRLVTRMFGAAAGLSTSLAVPTPAMCARVLYAYQDGAGRTWSLISDGYLPPNTASADTLTCRFRDSLCSAQNNVRLGPSQLTIYTGTNAAGSGSGMTYSYNLSGLDYPLDLQPGTARLIVRELLDTEVVYTFANRRGFGWTFFNDGYLTPGTTSVMPLICGLNESRCTSTGTSIEVTETRFILRPATGLTFSVPRAAAEKDLVLSSADYRFVIVSALGDTPEPATWAMMVIGFGWIGCSARRRRSSSHELAAS